MGCVCAKSVPIEDSWESPRERQLAPSAVPSQGMAPAKLSASAAVSSSMRDELVAVRLTAATLVESKQGNRAAGVNERDADMRRERQVHTSHQHLRMIGSIPNATEGEQVAAGWPPWLVAVAGEAIHGLVPRRADSFERLDKIGQGTYSSVYRARDIENGKIVALKKVRFDSLEPESVRFMAREIHILRRLDHPNIINLEGLVTSRMSCSLYLVFEYMEHDLAGLAAFPGIKFTEPQVKCYMRQLLCGLDYCHTHGVLHRDIKGSNLLIDNNGILKIADFGLASFFDSQQQQPLTSRVVTLWYRPPELLLGATTYDVAVDLWSTGCILAELYAGKPIMPGRTEVEQLHKIFKLCGSPSDDYWRKSKLPHATIFKPQQPYRRRVAETYEDFPASALALMEVLLSVDPADRGTAAFALKSEYFTTKPLPCDPSTLPKYPPSKELDAKVREEETRRQGAAGSKVQRSGLERGGLGESRAVPAPDANAELSVSIKKWKNQGNSKSRSEKFKPNQEEVASGFLIEPPQPTRVLEAAELSHGDYTHKISHSGPLVNRGQWASARKNDAAALKLSSAANSANLSSLSGLVAARRNSFLDVGERNGSQLENTAASGRLSESRNEHLERRYDQLYHGVSQRKEDESDNYMNQSLHPGFGPKGNKIHYSGPLPRPSGNVDQMLKDHDRQIQEAIRRARIDRSKARKIQGEGNLVGPSIKPYNLGVIPVYPSSRSSVIVFTSSRGAIQQ
ncbi:probable serine/threonine-protein kinase At1g54610 [Phalaenopsis equestris]|uniref:probable serine/threonine-protein kinase At1g54610 n=1 Tax=Phalaenopsis equestris TaxID=78828 RepID=UPI0009E63CF2|nr:probable serine/threonine-protein kinase At1g54610 [Phalaenopsis equestris]